MSTFAKTLNYNTYDVTEMLDNGSNAVGALLGAGFYTGQHDLHARQQGHVR